MYGIRMHGNVFNESKQEMNAREIRSWTNVRMANRLTTADAIRTFSPSKRFN